MISQSYGNNTAKQWFCCELKEKKVSQGEWVNLLSTVMALEYNGIIKPISGAQFGVLAWVENDHHQSPFTEAMKLKAEN